MAAPVPTLRTPQPGGKGRGGLRLGLAIPPSPNQRPVGADAEMTQQSIPTLGMPARVQPNFTLATPMGSQSNPLENTARPSKPRLNLSMVTASNDDANRPRSDSRTDASMPGSASSSTYSNLSFVGGQGHNRQVGTPDPTSAISLYSMDGNGQPMERQPSSDPLSIDFEKLSIERGHDLDVEDLDEQMWEAASEQKRIIVKGELGEGAGGAVTKCILKGGKTVFALKIITTSPDQKKQILRELRFNQSCNSDYICKYYGAFEDRSSSTISIVMEFCEGGSLDSVYREVKKLGGRTGEKPLAKIAEGSLHGLTYLNDKKIIHRGKQIFPL